MDDEQQPLAGDDFDDVLTDEEDVPPVDEYRLSTRNAASPPIVHRP